MLYPAELLVQGVYLLGNFSKLATRPNRPSIVEAIKKPMALSSPAKLIYLSMVEVIVMADTRKAAIDKRKGRMFNLTDIVCLFFNYYTNITNSGDNKKSRADFF